MTYDVTAAHRLLAAAPDLVRVQSWVRKNRPVARRGDDFDPELPPELAELSEAIKEIRANFEGRIGLLHVQLDNQNLPWTPVATAWPCGPNRMMTAGHVLNIFLPPGRQLNKPLGFPAGGVPADAGPVGPAPPMRPGYVKVAGMDPVPITRWICAGEKDMVVFEAAHQLEPIEVGGSPGGKHLCVLGYPLAKPSKGFDDDQIGSDCCSPGLVVPANGRASDEPGVFLHDATTARGYSGGPVFDLEGKHLVGLHFLGSRFNADHPGHDDWNDALDLQAARGVDWMAVAMDGGVPDPPDEATCPTWKGSSGLTPGGVHEAMEPARDPLPPVPTPSLLAGLVPDRPDDRDLPYVPRLAVPEDELRPDRDPVIEEQGGEGSCAAFALAAAIEVQLRRARRRGAGRKFTASVRMLDRMARRHDEWIEDSKDGTSLRAVVKGFFHNGVCSSDLCGYTSGAAGFRMTREMAKQAREITLGSYFRVSESITDMQMAVHDAGAVVVSAWIHRGWKDENTAVEEIEFDAARPPRRTGAHAFVVTGYVDGGFVVQNSWGEKWGGWDGRPGHAIWSYEDWARNVIDAWVIGLAPRTLQAFGVAAEGRSGKLPRPRRSHLIGHVAHSEQDGLVTDGALGMGLAGIVDTGRFLATPPTGSAARRYKALALVFHDPLLGDESLAQLAFFLTRRMKAERIYPFHVVHGLEEMSTCRVRLLHEAGIAAARFKDQQADRGAYLERALKATTRRLVEAYAAGCDKAAQSDLRDGLALLTCAAANADLPIALVSVGLGVLPARACRTHMKELAKAPELVVAAPVEAPAVEGAVVERWSLRLRRGESDVPGYLGDWPDLVAAAMEGKPRADGGSHATLSELLAKRDVAGHVLEMLRKPRA